MFLDSVEQQKFVSKTVLSISFQTKKLCQNRDFASGKAYSCYLVQRKSSKPSIAPSL